MLIEELKSRICRDLVFEINQSDELTYAITSFSYPDGDSVNLYFRDLGGEMEVSDEGTTIRFFRQQQVDLTLDRHAIIKSMCRAHDVEFQHPRLVKRFDISDAGVACLAFCEAVTSVSAIYYHSPAAKRSPLPVELGELLRKRVEPIRRVEHHWTSRRYDPKGSFPVEFHVNGMGPPRNIFSVTSHGKAVLVSAVVHFLKSHGIDSPTMSIVDPEAKLGPRDIDRLQLASTEIRFGIDKHHQDVVEFALADQGKPKN